jgi:pilus assembly protein CpaF
MTLEKVSNSICENLSTLFIHDPSQLLSDQTSEQRIAEIVRNNSESLTSDLRERVWSEFFDVGPLEALLNNHSITEVMVTGASSIYFERAGKLEKHD